ncbi:MAG: ABC transporter permease [Thermotogota bacterium]
MYRNLFRLAVQNIRSRRMRSWLTILGVLIGVTAVTARLSIGTGVQVAVVKQFEAIGYDIVLIVPEGARATANRLTALPGAAATPAGGTFSPEALTGSTSGAEPAGAGTRNSLPGGGRAGAAPSIDVARLLEQVPELAEAGTLGLQVAAVKGSSESGYLRVVTPTTKLLDAFPSVLPGFKIARGSSFTDSGADQVVVGARAAATLGVEPGDTVTIAGRPFLVVGVLTSTGPAALGNGQRQPAISGQRVAREVGAASGTGIAAFRNLANTADALVVLGERAQAVWPSANAVTVTVARVKAEASVSAAVDDVRLAIAQQGASGTPISVQEIADQIQGTLGMIETVLASIAAVALLVGSLGLMNTMYTAVLERTREIGVLKAIGARDGQVMALFMMDSGLMGLIGGILGLGIGAALSLVAARLFGRAVGVGGFFPIFSVGLVAGVLGLSFVVGGLSGAWPAWRAARLNPVEALTSE